jgi:CubicO group peptidase (beta-lactamase class C family)
MMCSLRPLVVATALAVLLDPVPLLAQGDSATVARIDAYLRLEVHKRQLPGAAVAVVKDGAVLMVRGYGLANVELAAPATDSTAFQIASLTKLFTGAAVLVLADDGRVALDTTVMTYLPGLPAAWSVVTVRQLLDHTSGIPSYTEVPGFDGQFMAAARSPEEVLALVAGTSLEHEPGARFSYSNTGYYLLGMLIERVTGTSYAAFLEERFFAPLGMRDTRANDMRAVIPNRAQGYEWRGRELRNAGVVDPSVSFASGMLLSSARDLAQWNLALTQGRLVEASRLAWQPQAVNGRRVLGHCGDIPGFASQISRFEDDGLTVIVLLNGRGLLTNVVKLTNGVAGQVIPTLARKQPATIPDPNPRDTQRYARLVQNVFLDGVADVELLTDEMRGRTTPERLRVSRERHALFGKLLALELLERTRTNDRTHLRYRAVFEGETAVVFVHLDRAGKIAGLALQSEQ